MVYIVQSFMSPRILELGTCRGVAQMGARVVWDHEVAGSIPVTPTTFAGVA